MQSTLKKIPAARAIESLSEFVDSYQQTDTLTGVFTNGLF
jgi:hypothetical protein